MKERISAMHEMLNMLMGFGAEEDATIAELRERIEARVPVVKKAEPGWNQGDEFWYVGVTGEPRMGWWRSDAMSYDYLCSPIGIYKTREEAEKRALQVRAFIEELNSGRPVRVRDGKLMP